MRSSIPTFGELLAGTRDFAVHLEMRDDYGSNPRLEAWRRGQRVDWNDRESWWHPFHQTISDAVSRGVSIRRARVVSEPVSEYIRWEHYSTEANVIAGEEVRWLPRRQATDVLLPANDFWLFDGNLLRVHHFAGDGSHVADELSTDTNTLKLCEQAFEAAWQRATPHSEYKI
ncbi:DUF6879 family protein [Streptomyces purpurogeneiscleroticus]|uniref:DUF6879 family protein n=1 Tax=Streptomyces purpurogeneiscleroticus TaxID=68259 RepID=UPI001CBABD59|nr:DUF6879 family protein [Streptomyces purpurogeneiscleroticus]MBZ4020781.1 hypothetical protein [Streptomyces purpurogeneiscleroticus]